jgi:hypothetical protein
VHRSCVGFIDNDGDGKRDREDADASVGDGILATTRCDQPKPAVVQPKTNESSPVRLLCDRFVGRRGRNIAYRTRAPRRCAVWRANWAHYRALTFITATWRDWGTPSARARVTITGNSGLSRARAHQGVPAPPRTAQAITRLTRVSRSSPSGKRKRAIVFKPDNCAGWMGKRLTERGRSPGQGNSGSPPVRSPRISAM